MNSLHSMPVYLTI